MTGRAEIRLSGRDGVFVADEARVDPPFVHATGRWRRRLATGESWGSSRSYTWSSTTVVQIRWVDGEVAT